MHEKRPRRAEVDVGHEHASSVLDARCDQPDEIRDAGARRHTLGGDADERGEVLARAVGRGAPVLPARPPVPPVGECLLEASQAGAGGRPKDAVLRYGPAGSTGACLDLEHAQSSPLTPAASAVRLTD